MEGKKSFVQAYEKKRSIKEGFWLQNHHTEKHAHHTAFLKSKCNKNIEVSRIFKQWASPKNTFYIYK